MKKQIVNYNNTDIYIILVPVFYDYEITPSWRKYFTGTLKECKEMFGGVPDSLQATLEQNKINRHYKRQEMNLLFALGKTKKAQQIKEQYNL